MCDLLLRVLALRADPAGAPLQAHLLLRVPGEAVVAEGRGPDRVLPAVPLDHLHQRLAQPAGGAVGQHGHMGPDLRGAAQRGRSGPGPAGAQEANVELQTLCVHVHAPQTVQLCASTPRLLTAFVLQGHRTPVSALLLEIL